MAEHRDHHSEELDSRIEALRSYFAKRGEEGFDNPPSNAALDIVRADRQLRQELESIQDQKLRAECLEAL